LGLALKTPKIFVGSFRCLVVWVFGKRLFCFPGRKRRSRSTDPENRVRRGHFIKENAGHHSRH